MTDFNLEQEIEDYECPSMLKEGLKYHININKLKIKSKKELDKLVDEFKKMKVGE